MFGEEKGANEKWDRDYSFTTKNVEYKWNLDSPALIRWSIFNWGQPIKS